MYKWDLKNPAALTYWIDIALSQPGRPHCRILEMIMFEICDNLEADTFREMYPELCSYEPNYTPEEAEAVAAQYMRVLTAYKRYYMTRKEITQ